MEYNKILEIVEKLKVSIQREMNKKHWENALRLIKSTANFLYASNLYYADSFLEQKIEYITKVLEMKQTGTMNNNVAFFYDGFGLNNRGLARIYLEAICNSKKVIYITYGKAKNRIPNLIRIVESHGGEVVYLNERTIIDNILSLNAIIKNFRPKHFFFYSFPDDVIGVSALYFCEGYQIRYQINLTDHAFWLGAIPIDICIEFRDYGAYISNEYRGIPKNKVVCIPYYPIIDSNCMFEGFPFEVKKQNTIVFSGGALYKTLGENNVYYDIVRYILSTHKNTIFWYAGSGDASEMNKIILEFPGRAFLTKERTDLYATISNCTFYLSTYPICGGLMFQYVARAGKIPVTLTNSNESDDFLLNQKTLGIEFNDVNELYREIDKLILDVSYRTRKEKEISNAVIKPETFNTLVNKLLAGEYDFIQNLGFNHINTEDFRRIYWNRMNEKRINEILASKDSMIILKYLPRRYLAGVISKVIDRINGIKQR